MPTFGAAKYRQPKPLNISYASFNGSDQCFSEFIGHDSFVRIHPKYFVESVGNSNNISNYWRKLPRMSIPRAIGSVDCLRGEITSVN